MSARASAVISVCVFGRTISCGRRRPLCLLHVVVPIDPAIVGFFSIPFVSTFLPRRRRPSPRPRDNNNKNTKPRPFSRTSVVVARVLSRGFSVNKPRPWYRVERRPPSESRCSGILLSSSFAVSRGHCRSLLGGRPSTAAVPVPAVSSNAATTRFVREVTAAAASVQRVCFVLSGRRGQRTKVGPMCLYGDRHRVRRNCSAAAPAAHVNNNSRLCR